MGWYNSDILVGWSNIHQFMYYRSPLTASLIDWKKNQVSFSIISSLEALPVYKTSCLCGIMFRDKYLDVYMRLYGISNKTAIVTFIWISLQANFRSIKKCAMIQFIVHILLLQASRKRKTEDDDDLLPSKYVASDSADSDFEITAPKRGRKPSTPRAAPKKTATPRSNTPKRDTPSAAKKRVANNGDIIPMPAVPPPGLINGSASGVKAKKGSYSYCILQWATRMGISIHWLKLPQVWVTGLLSVDV